MKLWCIPNGPVLDEIHRILVHPPSNQTGAVNKPTIGRIYDTGVADTLFTTPRHVRGTHPGSARRCHGCFSMV